jgi:protease YdgD
MNKLLLPLCIAGFLLAPTLIQKQPLQAQSPLPISDPTYTPPTPISLPLDPKLDGNTFRPSDRPQSDKPSDTKQGVIGADNRILQESRAFPWSAVGRLDVVINGKERHQCTGTLIGRDLVLTNSHCIDKSKTLVFKPALINGKSLEKAIATPLDYGWQSGSKKDVDDWAILRLDKPLGDTYGYLGWRVLDFSNKNVRGLIKEQIRLVGYSGDFPKDTPGETAGVHVGCSIEGLVDYGNGSVIAHTCDMNAGASGGAMLALFNDGKYYIVGLNSGANWQPINDDSGRTQDIEQINNRGVEVSRWGSKAMSLRQAKPK